MKFNRMVKSLDKAYDELEGRVAAIQSAVNEVSESELHLDYVPGDGWCFSSEITGSPLYMQMHLVLSIIEQKGRFMNEDWAPFG